jgi:hypothetical protein
MRIEKDFFGANNGFDPMSGHAYGVLNQSLVTSRTSKILKTETRMVRSEMEN